MANQSLDSVAAQVGNNSTTADKGIEQAAGAMVKGHLPNDRKPTAYRLLGGRRMISYPTQLPDRALRVFTVKPRLLVSGPDGPDLTWRQPPAQ